MKFLVFFGVVTIACGLLLRSPIDIPYLNWIGQLPGDCIVKKNGIALYFPLTSSFMISAVLSFALNLFGKKEK